MPNSKNNTYAFSDITPIHGYPDDMWHSMVPKGFADGLFECYVEWTDDGSLPIVDWEDPDTGEFEYFDYEIIAQSGPGDFTLTGMGAGYDDRRDLHGPLTMKGMFGISGRPYPYWIDSTIFDKQVGGRRDYKFKLGGGSFTCTGKPVGFDSLIRGLLLDSDTGTFTLTMGQAEATKDLSMGNSQLGKFYTSGRDHSYGNDHGIFDKHIGSIRDYRFKVGSASFDVEGQRLNVSLNKSPVEPASYSLTVNSVNYVRKNKPFYHLCARAAAFELAGMETYQGSVVEVETSWYEDDTDAQPTDWDGSPDTLWIDELESKRVKHLVATSASFSLTGPDTLDIYKAGCGKFNVILKGVGAYNVSQFYSDHITGHYWVNESADGHIHNTRWDYKPANIYKKCEPQKEDSETIYDTPVPNPVKTEWDAHRSQSYGKDVGFKLVRADGTVEIELSKTVVYGEFVINGGEVGFYGYRGNTRWDAIVNVQETIWSPVDKEWNTEWDQQNYYGDKPPPMPHC